MSEAYLKSLLAYVAKFSGRPIDGLYDLAWGSLALKQIDGDYKYFLMNVQSAISAIAYSCDLSDVLYDYRRAIGLSLAIYLFGAREVGFPENRLDELCNVLIKISRESNLAELVGASFLLAKHLKKEYAEKELKSLITGIRKSCIKNPAHYLTDMLYVMFFSALAHEDEFFIEGLEDLRQNQSWMAYVSEDPERMILLLYVLSKVAYSKNIKAELAEWCRTEANRIARELRNTLEKRSLLNSQSCVELIDALLGVAEGFDMHVKEKFGPLIRREGDEIIINRRIVAPLPRADLIAKAYLALCEAGYIHPFMLSKKEFSIYKQIQAELKGYRRIRKYELFLIMMTSALFIFLIPPMLSVVLTKDIVINSLYLSLGLLMLVIIIYRRIWESGHISLKELLNLFYEKVRDLRDLTRGR